MEFVRKKLLQAIGVVGLTTSLIGCSTQAVEIENDFSDVSNDYWAKTEINYLEEQGIINGYPDGTFKPNQAVTRYQAAAMLKKVLDLSLVEGTPVQFNDIATDSPRYKLAATMYEAGLIRGSNGNFRPNESLTRAQMATVLTRAFDFNRNEDFYFTDIQPDYWNYTEIAALADSGITGGKGDGTFAPSEPTSRAQFSVFLYRAMDGERQGLELLASDVHFEVDLNKNEYDFDGKEYTVKNNALYVREGDEEKTVKNLPTDSVDLITYSGSKMFYSDGKKIVSYGLLNGTERTIYQGGNIELLFEYQGKLIIRDGLMHVTDLDGNSLEDKIDIYTGAKPYEINVVESTSEYTGRTTLKVWEMKEDLNLPLVRIISR
ncbi:S-layer homology domain-containing protein [Aquibacillus albus]|uniref:SLH domain-containing protein n=1 Tax=Aquibacillus albus TaxID=1168171 RepID=A0ABS2N463_9BACI|nr:S-layer homology domain-containing protein [Aquibacillus albus]MBM7572912.1 hypothetical protein [Aquibacillus albus]